MANSTAKSHKSRKTDGEGKPRQRKSTEASAASVPPSSPVESPSSLVPATTPSGPPIDGFLAIPEEGSKDEIKDTGIPQEKPREQQSWYRKPDSPIRKTAEKIAVLDAAGHTDDAIAKRLKTTTNYVKTVRYLARKNGWWDADDEPVDLEAELANNIERKVVRNISASLDGQMTNWQTHEMTLAAAKGRGIFKSHEKVENEGAAMQVVAIRVEMPLMGTSDQKVIEENIGGTPAYIEGEVVGVDPRQAIEAGHTAPESQTAAQTESQRQVVPAGS